MDADVKHLPDESRFETEVDGETAYLTYERYGGEVAMTHTIVPRRIEGRGIAARLTKAAVEWAHRERLRIHPHCSYVRAWLHKNR